MSIGDSNAETQSGVFDWLIGHTEDSWTHSRRVAHDFAGMSLRGLVWTAPSGYALYYMGYGWQYALSGGLMGFMYYLGSKTSINSGTLSPDFGQGIPISEFYWGAWIWLVLVISSIARVTEHFLKKWEKGLDPGIAGVPRSSFKRTKLTTGKFHRRLAAIAFEAFHVLLNIIFAGSVCFYALVEQPDKQNKGQTFFGIYTASVFLIFAQAFIVGKAWTIQWLTSTQKKRQARSSDIRSRHQESRPLNASSRIYQPGAMSPGSPRRRPSASLIGDPFGHPAASAYFSPLEHHDEEPPGYETARRGSQALPRRQSGSVLGVEPNIQRVDSSSSIGSDDNVRTTVNKHGLMLWDYVELLHIVTGWIRNLLGLLGILGVLATILISFGVLIWNINAERFVDETVFVEANGSLTYDFYNG